MQRLFKRTRAFTLIEVLVSISILAIASLGFFQGQRGLTKMAVRSEHRLQAYALAQQKMTEIELQLKKKGFASFLEEEKGEFNEDGLKNYKWVRTLEKVDVGCFLPVPPEQGGGSSSDSSGLAMLQGSGAGPLQMATKLFENSVRKIRVTVSWEEGNRTYDASLMQLYVRFSELNNLNF